MMDIRGKHLANLQHLTNRNATLHDKAVIQAYQRLDPRTDQKIVADSDLRHTIPHII